MNITIRVYGVLLNEGDVLISRENYKGVDMFKFPGGGMEEGEGTKETLIREWKEELNVEVKPEGHLYTTDFHTVSTFDTNIQVMSIYYRVSLPAEYVAKLPLDPQGTIPENKKESFQWYPLEQLSVADFTFDTEKAAFQTLLKELNY
ncbi:MAG: NUDIX hydrolase [Flavobacteriia bacterium]|nr:NUDIX hydrolase [Flavobacteriia bacterium]